MRPGELMENAAPSPARRRRSGARLGLGLSLLLHGLIVLAGLAVWSASGGERTQGSGGGGGTGCVMVDLVSLTGEAGSPLAAAVPQTDGARGEHGYVPPSPDSGRETLVAPQEAARVSLHEKTAAPVADAPAKRTSASRPKTPVTAAKASAPPATDQRLDEPGMRAEVPGTPGQDLRVGPQGPGGGTANANPSAGADGKGTSGTEPGPGILSLGEVDSKPRLVSHVEPAYPEPARKRALSGKVMARFVVDESGIVHDPAVFSADPPGVFDASVLEAVKRWRFAPAKHQGRTVKVLVMVPVRFDIAHR